MTDYSELVKALRCCAGANGDCLTECPFYDYDMCTDKLKIDAADAIESLQKELDAANHQLKMYSMRPFDDEEEEE